MFSAGFARVDITPPLGLALQGNSRYRPADGILDPLELNAVAFSDGENKAVLITADLLYVMENAASEIRERIAENCNIPEDHIFMQGLHQHTSLRIGSRPNIGKGFQDAGYLDILYRKYCDVVAMALSDLQEAELFVAEGQPEKQLSFIRRFRMKDGSVMTNPGRLNPDIVEALGKPDNTVRLLRIKRAERDIALVQFSCHPDCIGGNKYTADWPGAVRRTLEKDLPGVHCILVNGPQGDTNHTDVRYDRLQYPREQYGNIFPRYEYIHYMARLICDVVLANWNTATPKASGKVFGQVIMKYIPTNTDGMERVEACQQQLSDIRSGKIAPPAYIGEYGEIMRIAELYKELLYQKVPVSLLGIGEVVFVGFGGEAFTHYGRAAIELGRELHVIPATLTNGGQGYLPTRAAFEEGGYEVMTTRFTPTLEESLLDAVDTLLNNYRSQ